MEEVKVIIGDKTYETIETNQNDKTVKPTLAKLGEFYSLDYRTVSSYKKKKNRTFCALRDYFIKYHKSN